MKFSWFRSIAALSKSSSLAAFSISFSISAAICDYYPFFADLSDPAGADDILGTSDDGFVLLFNSRCIDAGINNATDEDYDITGRRKMR